LTNSRWYTIALEANAAGHVALSVDDMIVGSPLPLAEPTPAFERIVFRTGPWRGAVPEQLAAGRGEKPGLVPDLRGVDVRTPPSIIWLEGLTTEGT
jgi:hypothetical protein